MNIRQRIFGDALSQSPLVTVKKPSGAKANMLHTIRVPREESRRGDMRLADRYRIVGEQVTVTRRGAGHEAELINIGGGGAMIATALEPRPWERIDLRLGNDCRIACRILWIREGRIGLEFTPAMRLDADEDSNAAHVRELISRHFPGAHFEPRPEQAADEADDDDRRCEYRNALIRLGTVHYDYQSTPARLRDISTAGVMIETSAALSPGAEPLIDLGDAGSIFGTVVWAAEGRAGLRFNEPFDWTLLLGPRAEAPQHHWEPPAHLRDARSDSRWEQHWQKMTLNELNGELDGGLKQ
jgi:hypothetical protein